MQLHQARTASLSNNKLTRVGRGPSSGIGKTAGRGREGATSRSGYSMIKTYEGGQMPLFRRLPKRGFKNGPFREDYNIVNLDDLANFAAGSMVTEKELRALGLIKGKHQFGIKVLGDGTLKLALTITADKFSKSAVEKIEKAGGKAVWVGGAPKKDTPHFAKIAKDKKRNEEVEVAKKAPSPRKPKEGVKQPKAEKPAKPAPTAPKPE